MKKEDESKIGIGWLAVGPSGNWHLAGWRDAEDGETASGRSAEMAIDELEESGWNLHRVLFDLPVPPKPKDVVASTEEWE